MRRAPLHPPPPVLLLRLELELPLGAGLSHVPKAQILPSFCATSSARRTVEVISKHHANAVFAPATQRW